MADVGGSKARGFVASDYLSSSLSEVEEGISVATDRCTVYGSVRRVLERRWVAVVLLGRDGGIVI